MLLPVFAPGTLFAHIFHSSPVAMTINTLPDGQYVDVNDVFCHLVGYSRQELIGHRAIDLGILTAERREPVIQELVAQGALGKRSQVLRHRSGEEHHVLVSAQLEEHEGQLYTVAIIQDLTDYLRTQDALQTTEQRFGLFFDSIPLPVWVFDVETLRILDANPAACSAHHYTAEELRAMTVVDVLTAEEGERFRDYAAQIEQWPTYNGIWRHQRKEGAPMDMATTGYTLSLNGRRVRLAVLRDITQQLAVERALIDGERRLQIITELSTDGIWDFDVRGGMVHLNEAFRRIYGAPASASDVHTALDWWLSRIHPDDRAAVLRNLQETTASSGYYFSSELRLLRADNVHYATVISRGHILRDDDGQVTRITGAMVDISRQMEIAEATAQATLEERRRLARDLHDSVTQSLYSITLLAEVARRHAQSGNASATLEQIERLGALSQQCLREMRLLVYELRPAMVEESGLVGALRQRLEAVEQRSGVHVHLDASDDQRIPLPIQNELFRVAEEALNNALKHAHASQLTIGLQTTVDEVALSIADNGRGFDAHVARTAGGQGLSNMAERVSRLGGRFHIDTAPGQATTIRVHLPLPSADQWRLRWPQASLSLNGNRV
ncbi:MAG TPA: PAS domain S-box protein [Promineifilum sp.]|nr:PAS domain S-box protein [Promineifilum sp.]